MNRLMKNILVRGIQGAFIGVFLVFTLGVVMMLFHGQSSSFSSEYLVRQYIAGVIVGFVFGALNLLFVNDRINILKATLLHFAGVSIAFIPSAMIAEWIENDQGTILSVVGIFIFIYILIWGICYIQWKISIRNINNKLSNLR